MSRCATCGHPFGDHNGKSGECRSDWDCYCQKFRAGVDAIESLPSEAMREGYEVVTRCSYCGHPDAMHSDAGKYKCGIWGCFCTSFKANQEGDMTAPVENKPKPNYYNVMTGESSYEPPKERTRFHALAEEMEELVIPPGVVVVEPQPAVAGRGVITAKAGAGKTAAVLTRPGEYVKTRMAPSASDIYEMPYIVIEGSLAQPILDLAIRQTNAYDDVKSLYGETIERSFRGSSVTAKFRLVGYWRLEQLDSFVMVMPASKAMSRMRAVGVTVEMKSSATSHTLVEAIEVERMGDSL